MKTPRECPACGKTYIAETRELRRNRHTVCSQRCAQLRRLKPVQSKVVPHAEHSTAWKAGAFKLVFEDGTSAVFAFGQLQLVLGPNETVTQLPESQMQRVLSAL